MTYTIEWRNDTVLARKYVNIRRDGEIVAQAAAVAPDADNKVGIVYNVILDGRWSKNQFEYATLTEWVQRFTK